MSVEKAVSLVEEALNEKDLEKRIKASSKVLPKVNQIPYDSKLCWIVFVEQILKDSLESGKFANS